MDESLIFGDALVSNFGATTMRVIISGTSSSVAPGLIPQNMPAAIPADRAYYWSVPWQHDVRDSMDALARGDYVEFDSEDPNDIVRWFLADDE